MIFFQIILFQLLRFLAILTTLWKRRFLLKSIKIIGKYIFVDSGDNDDADIEWDEIHDCNFQCTIETQLRAFYVKLFYKANAFNMFNSFLFKIDRKDPPLFLLQQFSFMCFVSVRRFGHFALLSSKDTFYY